MGKGGEGKAAKLFYKKYKRYFKEFTLQKNYQPDYILQKKIIKFFIRNEIK